MYKSRAFVWGMRHGKVVGKGKGIDARRALTRPVCALFLIHVSHYAVGILTNDDFSCSC